MTALSDDRFRSFTLLVPDHCQRYVCWGIPRVMEAYVLPFTISKVMSLQSALTRLQESYVLALRLSNEESILWRQMMPALAERCRDWEHGPKCGYKSEGPPVSLEEGKSPLCTCGEGKISNTDFAKLGKKSWGPFAKYVTRIAISPIFPIPYLNPSLSESKKSNGSRSKNHGPSSKEIFEGVEACENCGVIDAPLKTCNGCKKVKYCGQVCQKKA